MSGAAKKNLDSLKSELEDIVKEKYPAFDELLSYSLERRHLDIPEIKDILMTGIINSDLNKHLEKNVRLLKIDEISLDTSESIHLPGVENVITSMRGRGYSLLFIIQGDSIKTCVYVGLSKFADNATEIGDALDSYSFSWKANFPGSKFTKQSVDSMNYVSCHLASCNYFGILTGIPSLKREEETNLFVQGLERLIRAMRGKTYCWISIADPISQDEIRKSINACQQLQQQIHSLVETELSKATSKGKTVMLGMFGMKGLGTSDGTAHTDSVAETVTNGTTHVQNGLETYQRAAGMTSSVGSCILAVAGGLVGTLLFPGVGTAAGVALGATLGAGFGSALGGIVNGIGGAITGKNGFSDAVSTSISRTQGWADTTSHAISNQIGGGGFGSFGLTWTHTTTVGQTLLNRKAQYVEEILKAYEDRLHEGMALGMWNLGHYFCASDESTYNQGIGVVTSLFSGMDSTYEPPRALKMPKEFGESLHRFNNVYLCFSPKNISSENLQQGKQPFSNHPLGFIFNGPCTPVNTRELAIATPLAMEDIEGVTVSHRPAFGINLPTANNEGIKTLTLGHILDKGNEVNALYWLKLESLTKHLSIFGLTGSGKTNTTHNLLIQLWKNYKIPFLILEPAKSEYRILADYPELKKDLLVISAGINQTSVCPLRLNPFDFEPGKDTDSNRVHLITHIDRLKATFNASFPMYASMPYILEEAILEIYRERGWDLGRSVNRYVDIYKDNFSRYIPTLQDLYLKVDAVVRRKKYFQEQEMNIRAALQSRLSSLMVGAKGEMFNSIKSIPAEDLFNRPVVIELENMGDDDEKAFLMGLLVSRLYEYRKATCTAETDKEKPFKHVLVIEEAHRLLANIPDTSSNMETANVKGKAVSAFVDMLAEIRAYGESVFVIDQLPSRVSPNIVKGTGAKIIHRLLAKDDREAVGWTMGMNDEQINDLCLLNTGECIVNQDGDRKSYMCKIFKAEPLEIDVDDEISEANNAKNETVSATQKYKSLHSSMFVSDLTGVDLEDMRFRDDLYKAMLAIGVGQPPEKCLAQILKRTSKQVRIYWLQICQEIWGFYGGDYQCYLDLYDNGLEFLNNPKKGADRFRGKFDKFFMRTRSYTQNPTATITSVAYEQLFLRNQTIVTLNKTFDLTKNCDDSIKRFGIAIEKILPTLLPDEYESEVSKKIIEAILKDVAPHITVTQILNM